MFDPNAEFREPRVIELWEAAKRANLSKDELDSLKVNPPTSLIAATKLGASADLSPPQHYRLTRTLGKLSVKCFFC